MGKMRRGKYRYEVSLTPEVNEELTKYADELCVNIPTYLHILIKKHLKEREEQSKND